MKNSIHPRNVCENLLIFCHYKISKLFSIYFTFDMNYLFCIGLWKEWLGYQKSLSSCAFMGLRNPWYSIAYRKLEYEVYSEVIELFSKLTINNLMDGMNASEKIIYENNKETFCLRYGMALGLQFKLWSWYFLPCNYQKGN